MTRFRLTPRLRCIAFIRGLALFAVLVVVAPALLPSLAAAFYVASPVALFMPVFSVPRNCSVCDPDYAGGFEVEATGYGNTVYCASCASVDGLYVFPDSSFVSGSGGTCIYQISKSVICSNLLTPVATLHFQDNVGTYQIRFINSMSQGFGGCASSQEAEDTIAATPIDCSAFSAYPLTPLTDPGDCCTQTGLTVELTSVP